MSKSMVFTLCLALIWGSSFPISQMGIEQLGAIPFRLLTILISTIILFAFICKNLKKTLFNISNVEYLKIGFLAIPNIFIVPLINNITLTYLPISTATFLIYIMPCFVSLLTILDERKFTYISMMAIVLCASGVLLLSGFEGFHFIEYLMIFNAFIWALGAILSKKIVLNSCPISVRVTIQMAVTLILTLLVTFIWWALDKSIFDSFKLDRMFSYTALLPVLYIGTIGSALVYYFWFKLIDMNNAEFTSYAMLLSPVISIVLAVTIFDEELDSYMLIGGILILSSSCIVLLRPLIFKVLNNYFGINILSNNHGEDSSTSKKLL